MNTGAHSAVELRVPERDPTTTELIERAVKVAVREAVVAWTTKDDDADGAKKPRSYNPILLVAVVLLLALVSWREYRASVHQSDMRDDRIFEVLALIRADQDRMQGGVNTLYRKVIGDDAVPQRLIILDVIPPDAVSHGTQPGSAD